jgi:hypothetical protein
MKKYEHKEFVLDNKLTGTDFSQPVQKKLELFDKLLSRLEDTVDEDYEELEQRLNNLDLEIFEDMENEMEDRLENNEPDEAEPEVKPAPPPKQAKTELTDEEILKNLYEKNKPIAKSTLREMGFKGDLSEWSIQVGNFKLRRCSVFTYLFEIDRAGKKV